MAVNTLLSEHSVNQNPFDQLDIWYKEHLSSEVALPDSVSLGTSTVDGKVSVRTVLLMNCE